MARRVQKSSLDPSYMALTDRDTRGNDQEHEWA
jgi:hypothetical protein